MVPRVGDQGDKTLRLVDSTDTVRARCNAFVLTPARARKEMAAQMSNNVAADKHFRTRLRRNGDTVLAAELRR